MLYEFINMSDKITFNALNDDYARAATLLLGNGKAGCKKQDGTSLPYCMTVFHGEAPQEVYEQIKNMLKNKDKELINTLNSFAVCDFNEREIYENYTQNSTNKEKVQQWDDVHRTSTNQFVNYARKLAENIKGD